MSVFVSFPSAPLTESLVCAALASLDESIDIIKSIPSATPGRLVQWASYDHIDHELTLAHPGSVIASSYTIRKSLIRKHYLHRALFSYLKKHPNSILADAVPRTWDLDIAWADELDDFFADELWDLAQSLDDASNAPKWYILKAGMADRGNGIRLFNSKDSLRAIFEEFEEQSDVESDSDIPDIVTSQLRHFVVQEYLSDPLLVNPTLAESQVSLPAAPGSHKFHLRAYCIASGGLTLYLWPHILALFSTAPYAPPTPDANGNIDLKPHLTNTSLQADHSDASVRLLSELVGCPVLSMPGDSVVSESDVADITRQTASVLAEVFRAALASSVHFQPLPNAFELFGADLLVSHSSTPNTGRRFQVHILELNAEPAIEMTSPRLHWVLEDMFKAVARMCVGPFWGIKEGKMGEELIKCLDVAVRGSNRW